MNKSRLVRGFRSIVSASAVLFLVLFFAVGAFAASTIGTNMSTTGTFTITPATDSATSVQFQNTAGTNIFIVNSTSRWVGVGAAPQTTFEVQGTSSASYLLTGNTIQVGGYASVAYNRFGTAATGYSNFITTTNDVLINGDLEVDATAQFDSFIRAGSGATPAFFVDPTPKRLGVGTIPITTFEAQGTASASYFLTGNTIQVAGYSSVAYSRFGTATTGYSTDIDASNDLLISGALEVNGKAFLDNTASVAGAFEVIGRASASTGFVTGSFVVGNNAASSSTAYVAEFGAGKTGTISLLFGSSTAAATTGTCLQMKNTQGAWVYLRINGTSSLSLDIDTVKCHP